MGLWRRGGQHVRPKPSTIRQARRTLRYQTAEDGRVMVGAMWMPMRIIADSREKAEATALEFWTGTLTLNPSTEE